MKKKLLLSAVGLFSLAVSSMANAEWLTKVGDDVFTGAHTAILLGVGDGGIGSDILLECAKDHITLSYVEPRDTKKVTEGLPADLLIKTGNNVPVKFSAVTAVRNESTFALETKDTEQIKHVLSQLRSEKGEVLVGMHYPMNDFKFSFSVSAVGASHAVGRFISACNIELPDKSK